jgi:cAMP-dependent protein kinase regulator
VELDLEAEDLIVAASADANEVDVDASGLPEVELFSDLPRAALEELIARVELWRAPEGAEILRQGEVGRSFFVIVAGRVRIERGGQPVARLDDGSFFGEMALLTKNPRTASAVADTECELLEISHDVLDELAASHPSVREVLERFCRDRMLRDVVDAPFFAGLDESGVREVIDAFETLQVSMGQTVIAQGSPGEGLHVVLQGQMDVSATGEDQMRTVGQLAEGDIFGEMSLLLDEPASATVTALSNCTLLRLSTSAFGVFCARHPELKERLVALGEERARANAAVGRPAEHMV